MRTQKRFTHWIRVIVTFAVLTNYMCDAIVCYKCDSLTLEACAMSLDETGLPYEECRSTLQCVMSIVDSVTYRGCGSNTPTTGATYKKTCEVNLCNKGVFPPGRLKCHHCSDGTDCVTQPEGKPRPCRQHRDIDQCYTEVINANEAYRGCSSDTNHTIAAPTEYCDINGCNDKAAATTLQCAQCDSQNGRGCKLDLFDVNVATCNITQYETCRVSSLLTRRETCFVYHKLERVVRGCTADAPDTFIHDDAASFEECDNVDHCNARCLKQQQCVICDSTTNPNAACRTKPSTLHPSYCGSAEASSCYACEYDDWHVERGCGSLLLLPTTLDRRCFECDHSVGGEGSCNTTPFTRCYKCSSTTNPSCASWDRPASLIEIEECSTPGAACVIKTFESGLTLRGCESETLACNGTSTDSCTSCTGSFCNRDAFPPNRLRCFQCEDAAACQLVLQRDPLPCPVRAGEPLNEPQSCLEFVNQQNGNIVRGCRSNTTQYYTCMLQSSSGCHRCHEDGCNRSFVVSSPVQLRQHELTNVTP